MLGHENPVISNDARRAVCDIVWHEGRELGKSQGSGSLHSHGKSVLQVSMHDIKYRFTSVAPLLWQIAAAASSSKRNKVTAADHRLVAALSVLMYARNKRCNIIQTTIALLLHQNRLQKEGFSFLHRYGVSVHYNTMLVRLRAAEADVLSSIAAWKENMEENEKVTL